MKIDEEFDAQFYFTDMKSDIEKMDYRDFKRTPVTIRDRKVFCKLHWRKDILSLPFKDFQHFLIIGDLPLSYFPFILLCKIFRKKVYAWGHGAKSFAGRSKLYSRWFYNNCDVFFTYGEEARNRLIELGVSPERLKVIYNSLNDGVSEETQIELASDVIKSHFENGSPTLLFVGRLTKVKKLEWIFNAMEYHTSKGLFYNVLIIGEGEDGEVLQEMVLSKGLSDRVWFYGKCYDEEELSMLLYNADLCVSPGNVGLTALHAMSYGTPVLSHDDFETQMPEYETIVPDKTGLLYRKGDFYDFCNKIEKWIASYSNRNEIRRNCYEIINGKFNSEYQIKLLKDTIR